MCSGRVLVSWLQRFAAFRPAIVYWSLTLGNALVAIRAITISSSAWSDLPLPSYLPDRDYFSDFDALLNFWGLVAEIPSMFLVISSVALITLVREGRRREGQGLQAYVGGSNRYLRFFQLFGALPALALAAIAVVVISIPLFMFAGLAIVLFGLVYAIVSRQ